MNNFFRTRLNGHIIESEFLGHWDKHTAEQFFHQVKLLLIRLQGQRWGSKTDLRNWQGANQEAIDRINAELNRLVAAGSSNAAYIIKVGTPVLDLLESSTPSISGYTRKLFTSNSDAQTWLESQGFVLPLNTPLSKEPI